VRRRFLRRVEECGGSVAEERAMTTIGFDPERLRAPAAALETFFDRVPLATLGEECVALDDAAGRVLARAIVNAQPIPPQPRSAMDGFAVAAAATPGRLRIAGAVGIARPFDGVLGRGDAVRIPTGGIVPDGADAVVPIERARLDGAYVDVPTALAPGENVIARGEDAAPGEELLTSGVVIGPEEIGVLATLGVVEVPVLRRPLIGVLSTGDEIVAPAVRPQPGQVRDSNRYLVAAALRAMGADAVHLPPVGDDPGRLEEALREALAECDAVVLTGGSSVGDRDRTPAAVAALGAPGVVVHGLRVRPGKPTLLGAVGTRPILGLPGNPYSVVVMLDLVVAPVVARMVGAVPVRRVVRTAKAATTISGRAGWTTCVPVRLESRDGEWFAVPLGIHSMHATLAARAYGYVVVEGDAVIPEGAPTAVRVRLSANAALHTND